MFDSYKVGRTEHVPYVKTVIEKRAPTDDSIRIYDEMLDKCYSTILNSITIANNIVNVNIIVYQELQSDNRMCRYSAVINGIKVEDTIEIKEFYFDCMEQFYELVYVEIANYLAKTFVKQMIRTNNV